MKIFKVMLVVMFLMGFGGLALADEATEGTNWMTPIDPLNSFLNEYAQHEHGIPEVDDELGLGIDVLYNINETHGVKLETRYDLNNDRSNAWEVYAVYVLTLN